jgi:3-oxoacid CoA-transferase B subunit
MTLSAPRECIAARAARDIPDGAYVNLGIGIPTMVPKFVPADKEIIYQSENGLLGMGPPPSPGMEDPNLINASKDFTTLLEGGSICDSCEAFAMMRGGHLDIALMGAFEVSADGTIANWTLDRPGVPPGVGGAMDLAAGAREVWVLMEHTDKQGRPRIVEHCSLPATAFHVVTRIYTDCAVLALNDGQVIVRETANGLTPEALQKMTGVQLVFPNESVWQAA